MPQTGVHAITVGAEIALALQAIGARRLVPASGAVVSVAELLTGGQRNVLPRNAVLKGDLRARSPEDQAAVERLMRQVSEDVAAAHDAGAVAFDTQFLKTIVAAGLTDAVRRAAKAANCATGARLRADELLGRFRAVLGRVAGLFSTARKRRVGRFRTGVHASDYDSNDGLLPIGAEVWVWFVEDRLPARKDHA